MGKLLITSIGVLTGSVLLLPSSKNITGKTVNYRLPIVSKKPVIIGTTSAKEVVTETQKTETEVNAKPPVKPITASKSTQMDYPVSFPVSFAIDLERMRNR